MGDPRRALPPPKLKVAIVEAGSKWMTPLLDGLAEVYRKAPEAFPSDPVEMVKNRIHVSPFFEDGIDDLVNLVGVDQVLYGSDWPHPEGLAEPTVLRQRAVAPVRRGPGEDHGRQPRLASSRCDVRCNLGRPSPRWS